MIALLSAWLIGYALGRMWRPARKQKPARFAFTTVGKYRPFPSRVEYIDALNAPVVEHRYDHKRGAYIPIVTAQDSTK